MGTGEQVAVTDRVITCGTPASFCFATFVRGDGTELQAKLSLADVVADGLAAWKADADLGDHVSAVGEVISSRCGELSVQAWEWRRAAKALRRLPVVHKELAEETQIRQRYLDLIVRDAARRPCECAPTRSDRSVRRCILFDFVEVETPMVRVGTAARPFVMHSHALDTDLYLRIAPELYLKRCARRSTCSTRSPRC